MYTEYIYDLQQSLKSFPILPPAPPPIPPPSPTVPLREPFLVGCNINANFPEAMVECAATVGASRVNIDSCVLDLDPEALSGICKLSGVHVYTLYSRDGERESVLLSIALCNSCHMPNIIRTYTLPPTFAAI